MDLTPKQQTSEAIRQAETILVTTGQHPSVDQVSAVIGLTMILRAFGKKVSAVISDSLPQAVNMLEADLVERNFGGLRDFILKLDTSKAQVDKLRYEMIDGKLHVFVTPSRGNFAPSDVTFDYGEPQFMYDVAIVLGVPTRNRIDKIYETNQALFERIPMINLDFHRSNENYGAVNLIEPNASSLCEMLVALAESLQGGIIDAEIATALLMGIVASTDRFTAVHTTSKSLTVAAQMMAAGAKQQAVVKALYRGNQPGGESRNERGGRQQGQDSGRWQSQDSGRPQGQDGGRQHGQDGGRRQPDPAQPPRQQLQPAPAPRVSDPAPVEQSQRVMDESESPIIEPSHIEMSQFQDEAPVKPAAMSTVPAEASPLESKVTYNQPLPQMADFAAAAEILARREPEEHNDGTESHQAS